MAKASQPLPTPPDPKPQYGGEVTEREILSHGQMVVNLARQIKKYAPYPVELKDLVQAGWVGFLSGLKRYDPNRGVNVGAFCTLWTRGAIHRHVFKKRAMWEAAISYGDLENKGKPEGDEQETNNAEPVAAETENARLMIQDLLQLLPELDREILSDLWLRHRKRSQIARERGVLVGDVQRVADSAIGFLRDVTEGE